MFDKIYIFSDNKKLNKILKQQKMAQETLDQLLAKVTAQETSIASLTTSVSNIAADIQRIKDSLPTEGGLTAEEVAALSARLDEASTAAAGAATQADTLDKENEPA